MVLGLLKRFLQFFLILSIIKQGLKIRVVFIGQMFIANLNFVGTYDNVQRFAKFSQIGNCANVSIIDSTTSLSSSQEAAIGTGLQNIILNPF